MPLDYMTVEHWTSVREAMGYKPSAPNTQGLGRKLDDMCCDDMCKWLDSLVIFDMDYYNPANIFARGRSV